MDREQINARAVLWRRWSAEKNAVPRHCSICNVTILTKNFYAHEHSAKHINNKDNNQKASCLYCNDVFHMDEYHSHIATEHHCKNKHDVLAEYWLIGTH
jgi:hypothetical protein